MAFPLGGIHNERAGVGVGVGGFSASCIDGENPLKGLNFRRVNRDFSSVLVILLPFESLCLLCFLHFPPPFFFLHGGGWGYYCSFAVGASILHQRGQFITTEGNENSNLPINSFQTLLLLLVPAPVCRDSSAARCPCTSQSMLPFHLVSSETALVKDLAQSAPKPINSHFQAAVIRRDGWLDDSFLFSTSLLRQDPARDLLTSSWSREASVQGRVALGSSPLSLKRLLASYEKIRGANTPRWL